MEKAEKRQEMEKAEELEKMGRKQNSRQPQALTRGAGAAAATGDTPGAGGSTTMTPAAPGTGIRRRPAIGTTAEAIRLLRHFTRAGRIG